MITNKYSRLYHRIIASAQNRDVSEGYYERHHIIPRSLGGTDSKSNLVEVTAREHFILHYLLTKFTEGPDFRKMVNAFNMMNCSSDGQHRYMNSRLYDANRKHMSETMRINQTGAKNSQFGKIWMTNSITGISKKFDVKNLNEAIEQGWHIGRRSPEFVQQMKTTKRVLTNEQKLGRTMTIYKNGIVLRIREIFFYRDYVLDGWRTSDKSPKGKLRVKSTTRIENLVLRQDLAEEFVSSGLWCYGLHVPNHKGTRGKTYQIINGKKIFD